MSAPALATVIVLALSGALLPAAASAQEGCPPPPGESEIDQYVDDLPAFCPEADPGTATDRDLSEAARLPYTGLAIVGLVMAGTLMVMAGLAIRRRRESAGGGER